MKKSCLYIFLLALCNAFVTAMFGKEKDNTMEAKLFETSASGNQLTEIPLKVSGDLTAFISINPKETYQRITGFGGSFTHATTYLLSKLSDTQRNRILHAYFGNEGAKYSLTRTHINSCDFSLYNYTYASVPKDTQLRHFTIDEDEKYLIPIIQAAQKISTEGFKIIASPWTAPPWMKDNNSWKGGKLLPEYYGTWALYFSKYLQAYQKKGINVWGITVENEPLGNDSNWESMHYTPDEMNLFVNKYLGTQLQKDNLQVKILGFDQNRDEQLIAWVDKMYGDESAGNLYDGTAVHWYASTYDYFGDALQYVHKKSPNKHLINTEACVDAVTPRWKNDEWYWSKEAKDWGWVWAPDHLKHLHPQYAAVYRYAGDIIGCLNNWVDGWVDWNMVLDKQGGPNWAKNWCTAPVIVDVEKDEVYFTPLYYTIAHFSRFIRPGSIRIGFTNSNSNIAFTAALNPDNSIVAIIFNPSEGAENVSLTLGNQNFQFEIQAKAIQTLQIFSKL
jgi:glucosylceramidase